jgi:hypothetical protein
MMGIWENLDQVSSRGSRTRKAISLGHLHAVRGETLSQFFTPAWVVEFIWGCLLPVFPEDATYSLLDNSVGAASMFRCADPNRFTLHGLDIDPDVISKVEVQLEESGFESEMICAGMESVELGRYSAALINPPFSIPLSAPSLTPYAGVTHYGKFGPDSSALSHEYALVQALDHADVVAAIVPTSTTAKLADFPIASNRLRAIYHLPRDTFKQENVASVGVDLLIFGKEITGARLKAPLSLRVKNRAIVPGDTPDQLFQLMAVPAKGLSRSTIKVHGVDLSDPVVTRPVTADKRVVLRKIGRSISLAFFDGATQAKTMNAIYESFVSPGKDHRYPVGVKYNGQHRLNLDVLVLQDDPQRALFSLCEMIRTAGGVPLVTPNLRRGLSDMIDQHTRLQVPFSRTVYRTGAPVISAVANRMALINRHQRNAVVAKGDQVTATRTDSGFSLKTPRGVFECPHDVFFSLFDCEGDVGNAGYWETVHAPIREHYPAEFAALEARARDLGLDRWLTWDFQFDDLLELAWRPGGAICAWQMALGKSRLALSLSLLLEGTSLLVVKSRLVNEMVIELKRLGLSKDSYQVIDSVGACRDLKKLNIVSYERLRAPVSSKAPTFYLARLLKKRIVNLLADEGGLMANSQSQQTRSVMSLCAKRNYIFDGMPAANYPREMLSLASFACGESRSYQPYALRGGFIEKRLFTSASFQPTGRNQFSENFVVMEWSTNEFNDTWQGAKREVPKINPRNLDQFRLWISPILKRRVQQEPAVAKYVKFPVPTLHPPTLLDWDLDHLKLYIKTVEEFTDWYKKYTETMGLEKKQMNLTTILMRLEACFKAANVPSKINGPGIPYHKTTSKDRVCVELIRKEVAKGRKPIVFARNPSVLNGLGKALDNLGIENIVFTGESTIAQRNLMLQEKVRNTDTPPVLLSSIGVTQDGLNLPMFNTFIFYNRSWKAREEFQAIYRLIRPKQRDDVYGYFLALKGSIDEYMGQLVEWKSLASEAGLDYGEQPDTEEFSHFDAFIHRFLESVPQLKELLK